MIETIENTNVEAIIIASPLFTFPPVLNSTIINTPTMMKPLPIHTGLDKTVPRARAPIKA